MAAGQRACDLHADPPPPPSPCKHERDEVSGDAYEYLPLFFSLSLFVLRSCSAFLLLFTSAVLPHKTNHLFINTHTCTCDPAFLSRFFIFPLAASVFLLLVFFNNNKTIVSYALRHRCLYVACVISVSEDVGPASEQRPQVWERYWKKILLSRVK